MDETIDFIAALDGVLTLRPGPGDGTPEAGWGDAFFYYAPDGTLPATAQPFATVVTKDHPDDTASRLDRPGAFRVNIAAGKAELARCAPDTDPSSPADDTLIAHPVYGAAGWLAVTNPAERTAAATRELLSTAHRLARTRHERREAARR
ncbi:hypothetical protein Kpho02_73310 [Kitasatospora phosalacinea]|uniref:DUF6194 domain-containing protein n=2 Tax=Kitasatospora phosalacinea TaxID=2065 RepID=A0A9W6V427_9ACTN|nr:hypothetical protein Kpho02_73310 [Kitasatospora phosalacinea]